MAERRIGIRELKSKLSECVREVRNGGTIVVTEHGRPVSRAEALAWDFALRGYDAVQLASALTWQEAVGEGITLATFDRQLWDAGKKAGVRIWPETLKE